jgi:dUTP pyrophosphatase
MKLKIKKLGDVSDVGYSKKGDAAIDLRASGVWVINHDENEQELSLDEYTIQPGERIFIKTGIMVELPKGHWGNILERSGLAIKNGLQLIGGVVDENYRGEIGVIMLNTSRNPYTIKKNDRIAQMVIQPYINADIEYVDELDNTNRGKTGFGASGRK